MRPGDGPAPLGGAGLPGAGGGDSLQGPVARGPVGEGGQEAGARVRSRTSPYARLAVVALIEEEGRWLLLRLPERLAPVYTGRPAPVGGLWAPPGGRLEEGEGLEAALRREMQEELGVEVRTAGPCFAHLTFHKEERLLAVGMACRLSPESRRRRGRAGGRPAGAQAPPATGEPVELSLDGREAVEAGWFPVEGWVRLSEEGLTPWRREDIVRATRLAREAWRVAESGGGGDA